IGVRVEVPATIMEPICNVQRDPKFHIYTHTFDDFVRTFCVNHHGYVVMEVYDDHIGVNGHSILTKPSPNTNFAILDRIELTEPLEDTTAYGNSIARQITILGGGKPIVQKLGDLRKGRRSTWSRIKRGAVTPTLNNVTPGDISMGLPHRILTSIIEGIEMLDKVIPGIASDSTLIYAPEIKYSAKRVTTNEKLETKVEGLFVAGDGAGVSRGIVGAAVTGVVAARGILEKEGER
ncbi:MAG: FAD-dependent oxidoreductase, partial [Candidatus Jordarchaeales archaeon]